MFDGKKLWNQRLGKTAKEMGKYLPYIFNGHLVIVFLFLIGTVAYYYQAWVKQLPSDFPAAAVMALFLSFIVTYSPIYTLLVNADKIFLLPLETKLKEYFRRSIGLSFFMQIYGLLIGLLIFMPMYSHIYKGNGQSFLSLFFILLLLKLINIFIRWQVQYYGSENVLRADSIVRFFMNIVFLYILFSGGSFLFLAIVAVLHILLFAYYVSQTKEKGLKWEYLIQTEERRMMSFYRFANMFTDVPKLKGKIKRRKWLDWLGKLIPYKQDQTYAFLYMHTFVRSGDYFGLFVRLTAIGMIALYFLAYGYGYIILVPLFLFLTGFQLLPLWNHHQYTIWINLYPVDPVLKRKAFQTLIFSVLMAETVFLSVPILAKGEWAEALFAVLIGCLFSLFLVYAYFPKKLS